MRPSGLSTQIAKKRVQCGMLLRKSILDHASVTRTESLLLAKSENMRGLILRSVS